MTDNYILDEEQKRRWYTQIPNLVSTLGLSPYTFRLYVHFKQVAGDDGTCWQSVKTISKECGMSPFSITKSKRELAKAGLIKIQLVHRPFARPYHNIRIIDIWEANEKLFWVKKRLNENPDILKDKEYILSSDPRLRQGDTK
jgi:predicted transcriptional regulator